MREIKFRGWDEKSMFMVNPVLWEEESAWHAGDDYSANAESVGWKLMQYTGLSDKNGVGIYESDLLKSSRTSLVYQAVWNDDEAGWIGLCTDPEKDFRMSAYSWPENEVIGNIYENPELLDGK